MKYVLIFIADEHGSFGWASPKEITEAPSAFKFAPAAEKLRSIPIKSKSASTMCHLIFFIIPCP